MTNAALYNLFSTLIWVAGGIFVVAMLVGIVWMIVKWKSPEVQELGAPVRQYMLDDNERTQYNEQYEDSETASKNA